MSAAGVPSGVSGHVPHFDIFGHQHHRIPFKDKSHLLDQEIRHHRWLEPPPVVKTKSDLKQAQTRAKVPDMTYDFDGDGVVGDLDYFIGRRFDKDNDGRLTTGEQRQAKKALDDGFLNKFVRGLESTGQAGRNGVAVVQRNGAIAMLGTENAASKALLEQWGSKYKKEKVPMHNTKTAMNQSRIAEAKAVAAESLERYARACAPVPEPAQPTWESHPRTCPITNIRERAEADHQAARVRGGLLPMNSMVNPEREAKMPGLGYQERPMFQTRSALHETFKEMKNYEAEQLGLKAEEVAVPNSVRRMEREVREFEFRRPDHIPMTKSRLEDQRRIDRIEYDMKHFPHPRGGPREYPRFSDNPEVPFWLADQPESYKAMAATAPAMSNMLKSVSEPALKVTEVPFADSPRAAELPDAAHRMQMAKAAGKTASAAERLGSKTVKRWTAESIERGEGRNKPRLFDNIQPVRIGPKDLETLDITSSMEPIRNAATAKMREDSRRNAGVPKRSCLWADPSAAAAPGTEEASAPPKRTMHRTIIQSEPAMRMSVQKDDTAHEPRFFGSTQHISRPAHMTAVRSGGFQRATSGFGATVGAGDRRDVTGSPGKGTRSRGEAHHSKGDPVLVPQ